MSEEQEILIEYEDNLDFNQDIDESHGDIEIGRLSFKPSWVLYNLDYASYVSELVLYKSKLDEDLKDTIYDEYPLPIAYYFHQTENGYSNNSHRLQLLRSTWEAIIFVLYAVVVGEARSRCLPFRELAVPDRDRNPDLVFNDYLSDRLAQKLLIIERILAYNADNGFGLSCGNLISLPVIQRIRELNRERNEFMHTAALSEEQASIRYINLFPDVFGVLKDLKDLQYIDILHYVQNEGNITSLKCELFKGYALARRHKVFSITAEQLAQLNSQINQQNILVRYGEILFSITPFIHYNHEANGNTTNLCYFKRKVANARFEFEIVTRSESIEFDRSIFNDRINELRGLTR